VVFSRAIEMSGASKKCDIEIKDQNQRGLILTVYFEERVESLLFGKKTPTAFFLVGARGFEPPTPCAQVSFLRYG